MLIIIILSSVIAGVLIAGAIYAFTGFTFFDTIRKKTVSIDDAADADMTILAYTVLANIRDEDFLALSRVVHPDLGLVLSPCATIDLTTDRRFSSEQVAALGTDTSTYVWGVYNGSGEPIEMTVSEYFDKFVPAAYHLNAAVIGVNQIIKSGNALENIFDVFPGVQFVDFHIPGEEQNEEFGWSSLRLGFEEYEGSLWLITIVYSTWTA